MLKEVKNILRNISCISLYFSSFTFVVNQCT